MAGGAGAGGGAEGGDAEVGEDGELDEGMGGVGATATGGGGAGGGGRALHLLSFPRQLKLSVGSGMEDMSSNPLDRSELSTLGIPPTDSPTVQPGRHPWVHRPSITSR
jgi:hypothetical protein